MNLAPVNLESHEYPEQFGFIAALIGSDAACSLLWNLPGFQVRSIPASAYRLLMKQEIQAEFNGNNTASLAVKFKCSYRDIHDMVNDTSESHFSPRCNDYLMAVGTKCGDDVATALIRHFPGNPIYIPKSGYHRILRKLIVREHTGNNTVELASIYGVSVQWVYKILSEESYRRHSENIQMSLFGTTD